MIDWLSSQKRREKRKTARDAKLREELAAKARAFESDIKQALEDFTELTINGVRQRILVDRITIIDASPLAKWFIINKQDFGQNDYYGLI